MSNDDITYNQLRLFVSSVDDDNIIVGGFGWMNEYGFFYANYNPNEYIIK